MTPTVRIHCGEASVVMATFPADSIPCIVTSPPYDGLRDGAYAVLTWPDFAAIAFEMYRVLMPGGVCCWNVNDAVIDGSETLTSFKQAIHFKESVGFRVHDTMIYEKSNGSKPDPTRYNPCLEYIFILTKGKPRCFNPIKDKVNVTAGKPCFGLHTMRETDGSMSVRKERKVAAEFGTRSNVWKGLTRGQEDAGLNLDHPAMMPKWLARDLILSFSNVGDTILDPMGGSGTTAMMAIRHGRSAISIDRNPAYIPMAEASCDVTPGLHLP